MIKYEYQGFKNDAVLDQIKKYMEPQNSLGVLYEGIPFSGIQREMLDSGGCIERTFINGFQDGVVKYKSNLEEIYRLEFYMSGLRNGYFNFIYKNEKRNRVDFYDCDNLFESLSFNIDGERLYFNMLELRKNQPWELDFWLETRRTCMEEGFFNGDRDLLHYHLLQKQMAAQVIQSNELPNPIRYVAGTDVAYNELTLRMVGAIVVLDANTLEIVDQAIHEMEITFPYIPGLFSYREVPPLKEAYDKLRIKPDIIICDGHGVAHPNGMGMASHLGVELNIPTIGCAKSRLLGHYEPIGPNRGDFSALEYDSHVVGRVLRTQNGINPVFVSVGHKITLESACDWVLKMSAKYRLPETTRMADQLVRTKLKDPTDFNYPEQ